MAIYYWFYLLTSNDTSIHKTRWIRSVISELYDCVAHVQFDFIGICDRYAFIKSGILASYSKLLPACFTLV